MLMQAIVQNSFPEGQVPGRVGTKGKIFQPYCLHKHEISVLLPNFIYLRLPGNRTSLFAWSNRQSLV